MQDANILEAHNENDALNDFESAIIEGNTEAARTALRTLLFNLAETPCSGSVADAVRLLANENHPPASAAAIVLRAVAVDDFLQSNQSNQLSRNVVTLVEKGLPGLSNFFKLGDVKQTYEKFEILVGVKAWVDEKLGALIVSYTSLASLIEGRKSILSSLAHGRLVEFGIIYKIPEVKDAVSSVFAKLEQVSKIAATLAADVDSCERSINDALDLVEENPSFVTLEYLKPFLLCTSKLLHEFIDSLRGRFTAHVEQGWSGTTLPKRYPLLEVDRDLRILVPFRSGGRGAATDVRVSVVSDSQKILFLNDEIALGNISPGKFSVALSVNVLEPSSEVSAMLEIEWGEVGTAQRQTAVFDVNVLAQTSGVNWEAFTYADPYGTGPAEGTEFVGRREQVQTLIARMLRRPMEPSYITGQKRVGKTSLATAAAAQAERLDPKSKFSWHYILWGQIAHEDPRVSLQQLGEQIEDFIVNELPDSINVNKGNYQGSLSPLIKLSATAKAVDLDRRFIIIIDEFDEMPQELYLQGNLADTVFGNIRALTTTSNICLLLVGGENMPFVMDRQGQKLNKFSRVNLTYFDRASEWDDYVRLIRQPSYDLLNWHEDAVTEVYNLTNGNPYFSKIICSKVFSRALRERDVDVTSEEVREAVSSEISRLDENLFAHLWQDGIFTPVNEREPIVLKRKRVLAALARCIRAGQSASLANIYGHKSSSEMTEAELTSVLADFVSREVLVEVDGLYSAALPIFEQWLVDIGLTRLASDALSQDLAEQALRAEDEARVLSSEIVALTSEWPTYRGRHIGSEEVRAWLDQCPSSHEQRALFTILKATRFLSEADVLERIRSARLTVLGLVDAAVRRKKTERRSDIVISYVDGEGKSGQKYASLYAEENLVSTTAILPPSTFNESYQRHVEKHGVPKVIVIVDDMVGTGKSLAKNLKTFHDNNLAVLTSDNPLVLAFSLLATQEGQQHMLRELSKLSYDNLDFRAGEILDEHASVFADPKGVFSNAGERDRAKELATTIGVSIYKKAPLGYGGQGLSIVFPTTVPNNSLPLLHSRGKGSAPQWCPLFERLVN
ncbi:Archaeal ATPase [Pseudovibrio sp. Ad13]|uniref:phosphoribosyltransferase-like protein n=1 Tax=Pseudovibrio sp. Ad13 TaxID=989396 RepID=UPI0007AE9DB8|nr:ATP-binding protein [Pseudovibrio sp. Ad13]KZK84862.1 Archaeal ATPase [Pseudovibrio sp. Ad13]